MGGLYEKFLKIGSELIQKNLKKAIKLGKISFLKKIEKMAV